MTTIAHTTLSYMKDAKLKDTATVIHVGKNEEGRQMIVLDQTIFYPQGGGQPYDIGMIESKEGEGIFSVDEVRFKEGIVSHIGNFIAGDLSIDEEVTLRVDEERRTLHCRLHSAGHIVDVAMRNIGYTLKPTKGYHFPDSPYVEYEGEIPGEERESAKEKLEAEVNRLITAGGAVQTQISTKEELPKLCMSVPENLPPDKPIRVVTICGEGCPCGGTHVQDIGDIGKITIPKIKVKGGRVRVSYKLTNDVN